ncbi:MAG: ABC transporter substrate-binding protein [Streptosporangiaceae bacterium]|jgi:peptide/nickel transport system substrate-binding protein
MNRRRTAGLAAVSAVAALALAACGSSGSSSSGAKSPAVSYNEATTQVVNPSSQKGGTLTFGLSNTPDSTDPGNTYYAFMWNTVRLYGLPLTTYKSCPGSCGDQLVPGLASALGVVGDNGLTWTYHLQPDVKFEDGTTVTSQDVKYAVERTYARSVLPNGPSYFQVLLQDPSYPGPYTDRSKNEFGLTSVTTPNPTTIVFHLQHPFSDFDYVVSIPQTVPVPPNKDTGANYQLHPISTGPYMFQSYTLNKQFTLVPNPNWNPATDPQAKQLPAKIVFNLNVNANDIDNRLLAGDLDVAQDGTGVQTAARARILSSATLKQNADDPLNGFLRFAYINTKVPPLNNLACRRAVEYAADKQTLQTAYGGPLVGGDIASTVMPPTIIGYQSFDLYKALSEPSGDPTDAKAQLKLCGHPTGFSTNIAYRSDRPQEVLAAQALQQALSQVGIKAQLQGYLSGKYYTNFAGSTAFVHSHDLGIDFGGWGADWPDGYGFLDEISNGNAIVTSGGNTNIEELNDPVANADFAKAANELNPAQRNAIWTQIDHQIMSDAGILPAVYQKVLLYRNPNLTNVYVDPYFGMYNYAVLGVK